ncbi:LLM class flavin-dependent oxidoreductase [Actinoplanes oblitus]|uniref:LLM class flavin-dependent oxidoreductase n=1 Tax=Actinoplanes oblitus TaxID=3040509 RepID=A0ABY8WB54_9ACTN|nr:LLM class flavin-dependent oxidoreductase [Actinoplanes oblitus]WIM94883.1 LLM class flavin-dependent oxidoreductase [Actinoplanes oblitus]
MRFGIVILPDQRWAESSRRWRLAEEYGFDHAWTYDHLGWRDLVDGPWFDAVPTLTAAALVTERIRLGTYVASPNFRHPAHFAREATALDDISAGRLLLGLGAGGIGFDSAVLGRPELTPRARVDRFTEFLELFDTILRSPATPGSSTTWSGSYFAAVDARNHPGPVQQPRPPFVVAANGPRALRLAVKYGDGWVTTGPQAETSAEWWRAVSEIRDRFETALADAGRAPESVDRYLNLDSSPVFSMSSLDAFQEATGRAAELGFTDVITHWPRAASWYAGDEKTLEAVAAELPRLR